MTSLSTWYTVWDGTDLALKWQTWTCGVPQGSVMDLILFGFCSFMADRLLSDHFVVADLPLAEWLEGFSCCDCWDRWAGTFCSPAVGSLCNFLRQRRCATLIRKAFCSNPVHLYTHLCAYIRLFYLPHSLSVSPCTQSLSLLIQT